MTYGNKTLPTRASERRVASAVGSERPSGVTESVSNFYNGFLVFIFVAISLLAALVFMGLLYQFVTADYQSQKDALLLLIAYLAIFYLLFVLSVGLTATFLSMRRHLVYQSRLLEIVARNALPEPAPHADLF